MTECAIKRTITAAEQALQLQKRDCRVANAPRNDRQFWIPAFAGMTRQ